LFGRKDKGGSAVADRDLRKEKTVNPKGEMIDQLDLLEPGKEVTYRLGQIYVKPFITVARNEKGKRFTVFQDGATEAGLPAGVRGKLWDVNDAKSIASWIVERGGHFYVG